MHTAHRVVALATAAIVIAPVAVATAATGSDRAQAQSITFTTPFNGGKTHQVDLGKKGLGPGDMFLSVGSPLHDNATGARLGSMDGIETIVARAHNGTVGELVTLRLNGGRVTLSGIIRHNDTPISLPVTGGTGSYSGVGGQLTELREDNKRKVIVFRLDLQP
jgi:hypothetical protein